MGKGQEKDWIDSFPCRMVKTDAPSDIENICKNSKLRSEYSKQQESCQEKQPVCVWGGGSRDR